MSNELLTLKNLKQYFPVGKDRFVRAVDGVDLTINHGDVMGLVGESGSGKSTIAYTVMGMYGMTGGEIDFEGEVFTKETKRKRSMKFRREAQIVFQDPGSSLNPYQDVVVVPGTGFGQGGEGFIRLSYATSEKSIQEGLRRMEAFVKGL